MLLVYLFLLGIVLGLVGSYGWRQIHRANVLSKAEREREWAKEEIARLRAQVALHINK